MKQAVKVVLIVFVIFMSTVFVYGFIQKQQTETESSNNTDANSSQTSPSSTSNEETQQPTTNNSTPALTVVEVAKHNTMSDCYIIISDNVYDVGKYLDLHPGGSDVIVPFCGKDATSAFATKDGRGNSHSQSAKAKLQEFLLGPLQ